MMESNLVYVEKPHLVTHDGKRVCSECYSFRKSETNFTLEPT